MVAMLLFSVLKSYQQNITVNALKKNKRIMLWNFACVMPNLREVGVFSVVHLTIFYINRIYTPCLFFVVLIDVVQVYLFRQHNYSSGNLGL